MRGRVAFDDVNLDKVFHFAEIVDAHHYMEENRSKGRLVVVVDQ
jgi:NADPH:quinone reductase-like Zn-dependent oxidoreductase